MGLDERLAALANRLFSEESINNLSRKLESTKIKLSAETFLGMCVIVAISVGAAISAVSIVFGIWILILPAILASIGTFVGLSRGVTAILIQRRAAELEKVLPDALRHMASNLRAGVGIDAALEDIAKSKYGELSIEFDRVINEVNRGRSLTNALLALCRRACSPLYHRAFHLIVEGIERGAALAGVMDSVSTDVKEVQAIQRERKAATTQQVLFLYAVALFAAPFIVGLTVGVSEISSIGGTRSLPGEIVYIAMIYNAIQAFICGLTVGVIRYGKMSKGLSYSVPFLIVATIVFIIARLMIGSLAPAPF